MQQSLNHRGPDGRGRYFSPSGLAAFTHTRLSIIELSELGAQPMSTEDQRFTITFNGEIYNHEQLRAELKSYGHQFNSHSDTEVLLKLYQHFGAKCVSKLRGMFAFVIWDDLKKVAFAARDPLGIKPLYYSQSRPEGKTNFSFASELRTVLASGLTSKALDGNGLFSYFTRGSVAEPTTLIGDIKLLEAGHTLEWAQEQCSIERYWKLSFDNKEFTESEAIAHTRRSLESSIQAHFIGDVPVGIFLSGGIDSTALLALADSLGFKNINTYSIAFEDPEWNEGDLAQRVADHFGTNHTEFLMTPELARPLFDLYLENIDQPTIDGFNTFCVSKLAHDRGEKVVLSGLGGDELFAGYKSFLLVPKMAKLSQLFWWLKPIVKAKSILLNKLVSARVRRIFDFMLEPGSLASAHQSLRGIFSNKEALILTSQFCDSSGSLNPGPSPIVSQTSTTDSVSELEITRYLRNQLLRDSDVNSMAWGLELRVPFIDSILIDEVCKIPASIRLQQGKKLLTDAVPEIPDWVVNRPKQGFRFPFDEWFSDRWQSVNIAAGTPSWIKLNPWYRRWSIVVLEDWLKRYAH